MNLKSAITSNHIIVRLFLAIVFIAALLLILPLYMQNRMVALYEQSHKLSLQIEGLQRDILVQELETNKLSSLEHLLQVSSEGGLGLHSIPTKVRIGGEK